MARPEENELVEPAFEEFQELSESQGLDEDEKPEGQYIDDRPQDPEASQ